ncbi:hypothetical protein VPT02_021 [Vibrio phage VPT02]|nr:hypothetical protein VPT02_021 [Vibrio phage VPT02]
MISLYFNLCFVWMLFMLYDASNEKYNLDGWKHPTAMILFPGTFAAVILGTLFTLFDGLIPKILNCFKR